MELLQKINFNSNDTLYILGDVIDRGNASMKCLKYVINTPNIYLLLGNHEKMMISALDNSYAKQKKYLEIWLYNGGADVLRDYNKLPSDEQKSIMEYFINLSSIKEVKINEQNYVLVHAGLNVVDVVKKIPIFSTAPILINQKREDLLWIREKFFHNKALPKSITIFGHTPKFMLSSQNDGKVWRDKRYNDKIGIDGGCVYGGYLLALRLDDMAEFAVKKH